MAATLYCDRLLAENKRCDVPFDRSHGVEVEPGVYYCLRCWSDTCQGNLDAERKNRHVPPPGQVFRGMTSSSGQKPTPPRKLSGGRPPGGR